MLSNSLSFSNPTILRYEDESWQRRYVTKGCTHARTHTLMRHWLGGEKVTKWRSSIFLDITLRSESKVDRRVGVACRFHLQSRRVNQARVNQAWVKQMIEPLVASAATVSNPAGPRTCSSISSNGKHNQNYPAVLKSVFSLQRTTQILSSQRLHSNETTPLPPHRSHTSHAVLLHVLINLPLIPKPATMYSRPHKHPFPLPVQDYNTW